MAGWDAFGAECGSLRRVGSVGVVVGIRHLVGEGCQFKFEVGGLDVQLGNGDSCSCKQIANEL